MLNRRTEITKVAKSSVLDLALHSLDLTLYELLLACMWTLVTELTEKTLILYNSIIIFIGGCVRGVACPGWQLWAWL
jgi:hypothetical protein